jgi:hypothetical protein
MGGDKCRPRRKTKHPFTSAFAQALGHIIQRRLEDPADPIHREWPNAWLWVHAKEARETQKQRRRSAESADRGSHA